MDILNSILWNDPAVQSAIIQSAGTVIATVIASVIAVFIGKKIADREQLQENLNLAISDVRYLLAVEEEHCNLHKENTNESNKLRVRQFATDRGHQWSGKFTPGRAKSLIQ